ncbi:EF-hand domain-containing protein [Thiosocius teredinicola]|uniref:hypothetical protein n=1 Tax=Thiosocius teredinicola TaxID=1973002 RepID=UPI000990A47B
MKKALIVAALLSAPAFAQQPPQMPNLEEMFFKQFDADGNGEVSKQEFMKPTEAQFDHMDKNGDGNLDSSEVAAFNSEMKQRMQEMQQQMRQRMPQR